MTGRERPEEEAARYVVEAVEGVKVVCRDTQGAPPATHDFDIVRAGQPVGALEVTMLVEEARQSGLTVKICQWPA